MVVEQDAVWPGSTEMTRVSTVIRVSGGKVTAALRLSDLESALQMASVCRELIATE